MHIMEHSNTWAYNLWVNKKKIDSINWTKTDLVQVWLDMFFQQSIGSYIQSYKETKGSTSGLFCCDVSANIASVKQLG